uniref:Uncharacterized protein n=1 Tax=Oscillatoriales cyanobacterium SpSt-402 TaxID=2282168 RepID=A0A832GYY7_9CYAN
MLGLSSGEAEAITVSPRGVNIRTFGSTTVFLTFFGLDEEQRPAEALWCGAINANQSCVPGTVFGRLPIRNNLATRSSNNNLTDIMTIPASVARRAYQDALRGNSSEFFYVRRFVSRTGEPDEFVAVTCRLAGGGARVPLALTNVRLEFAASSPEQVNKVVQVVAQDQQPPPLQADIRYNGSGRLKGRWEVVVPGDPLPTRQDLLTEATLPIEQRGLQRRYTLVETFDRFLPPTGQVILPGPNPSKLPQSTTGLHLILLRIEATDDREGNSFTGVGTVNSGGVAGFPMPVLRYFVRPGENLLASQPLALLQPAPNAQLSSAQPVTFRWQRVPSATAYKLDVQEVEKETILLSAVLNSQATTYTAPPWLQSSSGSMRLRWRVIGLSKDGSPISLSGWREFQVQQ